MTRLVIIGGSDAGTEAALRAGQTDPSLEITMIVADGFVNYSICGLPFFVSGEVEDWRSLAHRDQDRITEQGINILLDRRARAINPERRIVTVQGNHAAAELSYDHLVIATGARPVRPSIPGLDEKGVHVLHTMSDGIRLRERLDERPPGAAVVVGSGYIGLEMADALSRRGIRVTLVGRAPSVLPTVDASLGELIEGELERNEVTVINGTAVRGISRIGKGLAATLTDGRTLAADLVVVGAGVSPDTALARSIGVETGVAGAIAVTRAMETSVPGIYAAGDCAETWHAQLERSTYVPLGTTAHKQGRVAGINAAGGHVTFGGSVGTQVVKVFDLAAARTGLSDDEASAAGFSPLSAAVSVPDHKPYYPGSRELRIRITGDANSGRLLGGQIVGDWRAEVAKRIDIIATGLQKQMTVTDLLELDLSYTPPVSAPWDPVQTAADAWVSRARHR